jgi:hypothetical protein
VGWCEDEEDHSAEAAVGPTELELLEASADDGPSSLYPSAGRGERLPRLGSVLLAYHEGGGPGVAADDDRKGGGDVGASQKSPGHGRAVVRLLHHAKEEVQGVQDSLFELERLARDGAGPDVSLEVAPLLNDLNAKWAALDDLLGGDLLSGVKEDQEKERKEKERKEKERKARVGAWLEQRQKMEAGARLGARALVAEPRAQEVEQGGRGYTSRTTSAAGLSAASAERKTGSEAEAEGTVESDFSSSSSDHLDDDGEQLMEYAEGLLAAGPKGGMAQLRNRGRSVFPNPGEKGTQKGTQGGGARGGTQDGTRGGGGQDDVFVAQKSLNVDDANETTTHSTHNSAVFGVEDEAPPPPLPPRNREWSGAGAGAGAGVGEGEGGREGGGEDGGDERIGKRRETIVDHTSSVYSEAAMYAEIAAAKEAKAAKVAGGGNDGEDNDEAVGNDDDKDDDDDDDEIGDDDDGCNSPSPPPDCPRTAVAGTVAARSTRTRNDPTSTRQRK